MIDLFTGTRALTLATSKHVSIDPSKQAKVVIFSWKQNCYPHTPLYSTTVSMLGCILETFRYYSRQKPGISRTPEKNVKSNSQTVVV